mmetsp:Transcript_76270/g.220266  ORF Transcript_76270/g.220266 Transcript_76270/m.220266 type:complete len:445 (-) Transcript_76270:57-1391(-)
MFGDPGVAGARPRQPQWFVAAAIGFAIFAAAAVGAADEGSEQGASCPSAFAGALGSPCAEAPLRWRGFPYRVTNPRFKRSIYGGSVVRDAFAALGYEGPEEGEEWDILWTHKPQKRFLDDLVLPPRPGRRVVNHCDYYAAAGNKCRFTRHMRGLAAELAQGPFRDLPSFELDKPAELAAWRKLVEQNPDQHWLLKPCFAGNSNGIVIKKGQALIEEQRTFGKGTIAQEYLEQPFMGFGARKFHLRLYVVVTRWAPFAAFFYDGGLIFRSRHEHADDGTRDQARDAFSGISKSVEALPLEALWAVLDAGAAASSERPSAKTRARIAELLRVVLSTRAEASFGVFHKLAAKRPYSCFDIFGADVLLDEELRPALMEINIGPNMWVDDRGAQHKALLLAEKQPLMEQVLRWAALRARRAPGEAGSAEALAAEVADEDAALVNFTRLA